MTQPKRGPQAFVIDAEGHVKTEIAFARDEVHGELAVMPTAFDRSARRQFPWAGILVSSLFALVSLWAGLAITTLVEDFFARSAWLGWAALSVASLAGLAALAIMLREITGLMRLRKIEHIRNAATRAITLDEQASTQTALAGLDVLYGGRADMALPLREFRSHAGEIIDPSDRMKLANRLLMAPLDAEAQRIIARRARRVTLLTTVTPAAALDIIFVAAQNAGMLRELATHYGGRPSTLATLKLARMVVVHLAITGGLALSDNLIQHLVGKGLLGRLSARFGEGAVNGILTCRIGLAARDVCRPIPASANNRETLASLLREVVNFGGKDKKPGDGIAVP